MGVLIAVFLLLLGLDLSGVRHFAWYVIAAPLVADFALDFALAYIEVLLRRKATLQQLAQFKLPQTGLLQKKG